jgi:histidinol phosphatase-like PHP family hydrolase
MINLHNHTYFSDGCLGPSELAYRAKLKGYSAIGLTDHGDFSNIDHTVPRLVAVAKDLSREYQLVIVPGIELTYVPPRLIPRAARLARKCGAQIVLVHGETPAEEVPPGTNHAAVSCNDVDILAHPGYITVEDSTIAKKNNVFLEITSRRGHCAGNAHVAHRAKETGARMVFNTDTHAPEDLVAFRDIKKILARAKLIVHDFNVMQDNALLFLRRK